MVLVDGRDEVEGQVFVALLFIPCFGVFPLTFCQVRYCCLSSSFTGLVEGEGMCKCSEYASASTRSIRL